MIFRWFPEKKEQHLRVVQCRLDPWIDSKTPCKLTVSKLEKKNKVNPFERCELANIPAKIKLLKDKIAKSSLVRISFHFISTTFPPTISRQSKQKKLTRMTLRILFRSTRDPKVWLNPRHTSQFLVEIIEESPKISRSLAYPFFGGDILTPPCLTHDDGTPTMKNIIGLFC